jgi:hypothetical protein
MIAADQVIAIERAATSAAITAAGHVTFWAVIAARSRDSPAAQGQALGFALAFAHGLLDRGADPRDVRHLLEPATLGGEP